MLCRLLKDTGVAGAPGSHFHKPDLSVWCSEYGIVGDPKRAEADTLCAVVDAALEKGRGGTPIFGLRMQRGSFAFFEEKLAVLFPDEPDTPARIKRAFGRTLYIRLQRQDIIDQAISYTKAQQTGLWHRNADGTELESLTPPSPPVYDFAQLEKARVQFERFNVDWQAWFDTHAIEPLHISYDALSDDPRGVLASVLAALSLDPSLAEGIYPGVARLADTTNAQWKARFLADRADGASRRTSTL